jgi:hypothetical protein
MAGEKPCGCMRDPFAALPPEMQPKQQKESSLRKTTCTGCGREYWTNRSTDICFDCEKTKSQ